MNAEQKDWNPKRPGDLTFTIFAALKSAFMALIRG
jgi:hypothetical protein